MEKKQGHLYLRRPCKKCGLMFNPTSKFNRLCPICTMKSGRKRKNEDSNKKRNERI